MNNRLFEIEFYRARQLYGSGIFTDNNSLLRQSAFVEILIKLNYCLQYLSAQGKRINFTDDIDDGDVTDLINTARNCACHIINQDNKIDTNTFIYNIVQGRVPNAVVINGCILGSDYGDEVVFFYGKYRVYLYRHIGKVIDEILLAMEKQPS